MVVTIKKQKIQKGPSQKRKLKFEDYKNSREATNFEKKNYLDVDSLKENLKEFIKNNKLISKSQIRFRIEKRYELSQ